MIKTLRPADLKAEERRNLLIYGTTFRREKLGTNDEIIITRIDPSQIIIERKEKD